MRTTFAQARAACLDGKVDDLPKEIKIALKLSEADQKLRQALGLVDRMLTNKPFYYYAGLSGHLELYNTTFNFVDNYRIGCPKSYLRYFLGDGTSTLNICQNNDETIVQLQHLFPVTDEVKQTATKLGIAVRKADDVTPPEILNAIESRDPYNLMFVLADLDELITGKRLVTYGEDSSVEGLHESIVYFFNKFDDLNPRAQLEFQLSDGGLLSHLIVKYETCSKGGIGGRTLSFSTNTINQNSARKIEELKRNGLLSDQFIPL